VSQSKRGTHGFSAEKIRGESKGIEVGRKKGGIARKTAEDGGREKGKRRK